jgi:2-polyprenyl-3-methyl-5-hydroxy-6-metoxy-1,4-benzoquinol methylase
VITKEKILDANRRTHRIEAPVYDAIHGEIFNRTAQYTVRRLLRQGIDTFESKDGIEAISKLAALDCACGTGNISEKLLALGCKVDAVDISLEMLSVMDRKLKPYHEGSYQLIHSDVDSYLNKTDKRYDIISFSSALHHLPDYGDTFLMAIKKLRRPGIIFIIHEPLPQRLIYISTCSKLLRKVDRLVWKYSGKVIRRKGMAEAISEDDADLKDFHAHRGG